MFTADKKKTGAWGEKQAARFLKNKGYKIIDKNWRNLHKEIDLIVQLAEEIVFVEVKTRSTDLQAAAEALTHRQLQTLKWLFWLIVAKKI